MIVEMVAVTRLSRTAKRISGEVRAAQKVSHSVKASSEMTMPAKNSPRSARAEMVAARKTRSPAAPRRTLNTDNHLAHHQFPDPAKEAGSG